MNYEPEILGFKTPCTVEEVESKRFEPGNLFLISDKTIFYMFVNGEFGTLKTPKSLENSYILFIEKNNNSNCFLTLKFFHHEHGILFHDLEIKDPSNIKRTRNFFEKLFFIA